MKYRFLSLLLLLGFAFQAQAVPVISFEPSDQSVGFGETVTVDLTISGLGDDILTAFDIDVFFDDTLVTFDSFTFGTGLDVFGFGTLNDVIDFGGGLVNVFELSFDLDDDLFLFQPDEFVLGTFTFIAGNTIGTTFLDIFVNALAGQLVYDPNLGFDVAKNLQADVQAGSISVPEPGTLLLFAAGLLGMGIRRRSQAVRA